MGTQVPVFLIKKWRVSQINCKTRHFYWNLFVIGTKSCVHVLTVVDVISPALYFFFLLKKFFRCFVIELSLRIPLALAMGRSSVPPSAKIRWDSTCYWASALLEMLFIPSRHHLLLHLIGKRKRTLRLVVNRDVAERVCRGIHQNVLQVMWFFPGVVQWF